jgi:hypothetical protein
MSCIIVGHRKPHDKLDKNVSARCAIVSTLFTLVDGVELWKCSKQMGQCVIDDAHGTHKYNMRFSSRH